MTATGDLPGERLTGHDGDGDPPGLYEYHQAPKAFILVGCICALPKTCWDEYLGAWILAKVSRRHDVLFGPVEDKIRLFLHQ